MDSTPYPKELSSLIKQINDAITTCETVCCDIADEIYVYYFPCSPNYTKKPVTLLSRIPNIIGSAVTQKKTCNKSYVFNVINHVSNKLVISETIRYIKLTGRFQKLEA